MDMPYYVFNFTADFHTEVMDRFVDAYENGCTLIHVSTVTDI